MDSRRQNDLKPLREILPLEASIFCGVKILVKQQETAKINLKF